MIGNERIRTSHHEAAHAIIALSLGCAVDFVNITETGRRHGVCLYTVPKSPLHQMVVLLAGCEAEHQLNWCRGRQHLAGIGSDVRSIARILHELDLSADDAIVDEARKLVRRLVGRNWSAIERLATWLLAHEVASGTLAQAIYLSHELSRKENGASRMTPKQAFAWTDNLLTRISRSYAIHYHDDGELHVCTFFPGPTLADVSLTGWPDDYDLQGVVCDEFVAAVAADPHDGYLAIEPGKFAPSAESVGLTEEELAFASETEFAPNAPHQLPAELLARWEREDAAEAAEDDLQQRKRDAMQSVRQVLQFGATLCRNGYRQHAAALSAIARDGWEAIEDPAAVEQLAAQAEGALLECGATTPGGNYY